MKWKMKSADIIVYEQDNCFIMFLLRVHAKGFQSKNIRSWWLPENVQDNNTHYVYRHLKCLISYNLIYIKHKKQPLGQAVHSCKQCRTYWNNTQNCKSFFCIKMLNLHNSEYHSWSFLLFPQRCVTVLLKWYTLCWGIMFMILVKFKYVFFIYKCRETRLDLQKERCQFLCINLDNWFFFRWF